VRWSPPQASSRGTTLDSIVRLAVQRFVGLLVLCGCSPAAILLEVKEACARCAKSERGISAEQQWANLGHALTIWFSDPAYLDQNGNPRALPLYGPTMSIEALAHRADPELDVREVLEYLERGGGIRRRGDRYIPRTRTLIFGGRPRNARPLTGLFGLIRTLDHNLRRPRGSSGRLEQFSRNPRIPVSAISSLERQARDALANLLVEFDARMQSRALKRKRNEPTVSFGFGLYEFEEDAPKKPARRPRRRRK
jgi:Family of unknown function (DUF6502)